MKVEILWPELLETESLPTLCAKRGCHSDAYPGKKFCFAHLGNGPRRDLAKQDQAKSLFLYAIRGADAVKFGKTYNLRSRFSGAQTDSPVPLTLWGAMVAPTWLEAAVHEAVAPHRMHGEWFRWGPETEQMAELIRESDYEAMMRIVRRPILPDDRIDHVRRRERQVRAGRKTLKLTPR